MKTFLLLLLVVTPAFPCTEILLRIPIQAVNINASGGRASITLNAITTTYDGSNGGAVTIEVTSTGPFRATGTALMGSYGSNSSATLTVTGDVTAATGTGTITFRFYCGQFVGSSITVTYTLVGGTAVILPTWGQNENTALTGDPISSATREMFLEAPISVLKIGRDEINRIPFDTVYASLFRENGISSALGNNMMTTYDQKITVAGDTATVTLLPGRLVRFGRIAGLWQPAATENLPHQLRSAGTDLIFLDGKTGNGMEFDSQGRMKTLIGEIGRIEVLRGPSGPTRATNAFGGSLDFTYTGTNLSSLRFETGSTFTFQHQDGNLISATDPLGRRTTYTYTSTPNRPALLLAVTLPGGNRPWTQTYDSEGLAASQTDSFNNVFNFTAPAANSTRVTGPLNYQATFTNDANRNFTSFADSNGVATRLSWDTLNRHVSTTNRLGGQTSYTYTPVGYPATITNPLGQRTSFSYTARSNNNFNFSDLTSVTRPNGDVTRFEYNLAGLLTRSTEGTASWNYTYNAANQLLTATNPLGGVATNTYANGLLSSFLYGTSTFTLGRNNAGAVTSFTWPDGAQRRFDRNLLGYLTRRTDENGASTNFTYNDNGLLTGIADPLGGAWNFQFDTNNRPTSFILPQAGTYRLGYDALGRYSTFTDPLNTAITAGYNNLNQITSLRDAAGSTYNFTNNAEGFVTAFSNPLNQTYNITRDVVGRPLSIVTPRNERFTATYSGRTAMWTNPAGATLYGGYHADELPTFDLSAVDLRTGIQRDGLDLPTSWIDANGSAWSAERNPFGLVTGFIDPNGARTTYQYNNRWLPTMERNGNLSQSYTYDRVGNLNGGSGGLEVTRNPLNLITRANGVTLAYDANSFISNSNGIGMTRDASGGITAITYAPNKIVRFSYDTLGRPASVTDWNQATVRFAYNTANQFTGFTLPNGVETTYAFDANGRIASTRVARGSAILLNVDVTRDSSGRITSEARTAATIPDLPNGLWGTAYDAASQPVDTQNDSLGRLTTQGTRQFVWEGRYIGTSRGPDGNFAYTHDAFGSRISRTIGLQTETYVRNFALPYNPVSVVRNGAGDLRYNIYHPYGFPLYTVDAATNQHLYFHFDHLGNTNLLTNDAGVVAATYATSPYGEFVQHSGQSSSDFTFMGAYNFEREGDTNFYFTPRSVYDGNTHRYIERNGFPQRQIDFSASPYYFTPAQFDNDMNPFTPAFSPTPGRTVLAQLVDNGRRERSGGGRVPQDPFTLLRFTGLGALVEEVFEIKPQEPFGLGGGGKHHHGKGCFVDDSLGLSDDPYVKSSFQNGFGEFYDPRIQPEASAVFHGIYNVKVPGLFGGAPRIPISSADVP